MVSEIIGASADSKSTSSASVSVDDLYEQASSRSTTSTENDSVDEAPAKSAKPASKKSAPSLDDLYNDL
jgi:hypothetical protein